MMFLYIFAILIALLIILVLAAPKNYNVSRSITIDRSIHDVYAYLKYIKNQDDWSPWQKRDPEMKKVHTGEDGKVGFVVHWESDHKHVGWGEQEITKLEENKLVESELRFLKPFKSTSNGYLSTKAAGQGTKVTWGFYGTHKVPMNVMMLFFNMDKAVGKDFEEGLADLKTHMEA
jgi:hypothetical protein